MLKMNNTQAFYKLSLKRREIEEALARRDLDIHNIKEHAKQEKKGSEYRKQLMESAKYIEDSEAYKILKAEYNLMNFCINTLF